MDILSTLLLIFSVCMFFPLEIYFSHLELELERQEVELAHNEQAPPPMEAHKKIECMLEAAPWHRCCHRIEHVLEKGQLLAMRSEKLAFQQR